MLRTTNKEKVFFDDFLQMLDVIHQSAVSLEDLMTNYTNIKSKISDIMEMEHNCDLIAHKAFARINSAFITPIDREDIYLIIKSLDEIIDHIEETANRFQVYNIKEIKPEAIVFCKLIVQSVIHLKNVVTSMRDLKTSKDMKDGIIEVNRLENQGDVIYRTEISKLFANDTNPIEIITWNGIYDYLEKALDSCEDVANIIEGVAMKHA